MALKKPVARPVRLDLPSWEDETIAQIFNVTLDVRCSLSCQASPSLNFVTQREKAEKSAWEIVWLKYLAEEIQTENPCMLLPRVLIILLTV